MTVTPKDLYAPHPLPRRGLGFFISYCDRLGRICYSVDNVVYQRGLDKLLDTDYYSEHQDKVSLASYSPTGLFIASSDVEGRLRIWAPTNKEHILKLEARPISGPVYDMSWTEDNERLACIGKGQKSYGCVINAKTGASLGEVMGHTAVVQSCALRAQRPFRFVTGGDDCQSVFYKGPPFKFDHTAHDHDKFILCVRYAPDGSVYITTGLDGKLCIYDGPTGEHKATHQLPCGVSTVSFSPDSKQVLCSLMDGRNVIVNVETGATEGEWSVGSEVYHQQMGCLWTKNIKFSISLNGDFNYLEEGGKVRTEYGHTAAVNNVVSIPGGFVSGDAVGRVLFWKNGEAPYACFSPEGESAPVCGMVVLPGNDKVAVSRLDGVLTILNVADGTVNATWTLGKKGSGQLVAKNDYIATYLDKNLLVIRGQTVNTYPLSFAPAAIAVSQDGAEIALGENKTVHFYTPNGEETAKVTGLFKECCAIAYSPDNTKVAASSINKEIMIWDRSDLENPLIDGWRFHSLAITKILWIDNENLVTVSKDRSIRLWSMKKRRVNIECPRAHVQSITDAEWLEENLLITSGIDGALRTWTIEKIQA
ncbi:WD40 repeat-like protein [Tritrichomonas musculus]|uniref:WD40 repeat-like protein n=1 Tax=Tritrichomonas musculus TaxID=1915356 RepID=A0ABR2KQ19_9EUKA